MTGWSDVMRHARQRALVRAWITTGARLSVIAAAAGGVLIILDRVLGWGLQPWLLIAAPVAAALLVAGLVAWLRRADTLTIATELDTRLGLKNALGSAAALSAKPAPTGFEAQAIADGNAAAATVDLRRAMPLPSTRAWWPAAAIAALAVAAAFIPAGWLAPVQRLITGRTPEPAIVTAQRKDAADSATAVEKVLEAVKPAPVANEPPATKGSETLLSDLQRDLKQGKVTPEEGRQRTATVLEHAADELNHHADAADAARAALRDRLAETQKQRPQGAPPGESDLSKALREGDLEKAAKSADDLAKAMEQMPQTERKKLADELKELAKDLDAQKPQPATPQADKPADSTPPKNQPAGKPPEPTAPDSKPPESSPDAQGQQKAEEEKHELSQNLKDAAKELEKPPSQPQPPQSSPANPDKQDATEQNKTGSESTSQSKPEGGNQDQKQPQQPNGQTQPSPGDQPQPKPGDKPGEKPSEKPGEQGSKDQPGQTPQPKPGEKPADKPDQQPGLPNPNGQPDQQPQNTNQSPEREHGEKNESAPQPQPSPGAPVQGSEKTDKPGDKPNMQPDGQQPGDQPDPAITKEGLQRLKEQLDKLSQDQKDALRDRMNSEKLREQAQKMWDKASPDEKKQLMDLAKQLADQNKGQPQSKPQSGGENTGHEPNPDQPPLAGGGGDEKGNDHHGGPGDGTGQNTGATPNTGPMATRDVDARREPEGNAASAKIIAEWLSQNPQKRASGPANPAVTDAVRTAAQSAERAVDQRVVPNRLSPLVKKYFERLPGALGVPAETPPPAPSPGGTGK